MGKLSRFGVSIDEELLAPFDELLKSKGYETRSEAIRDLIRSSLAEENWGRTGMCGGILTLVYDHHKHDLGRRLMNLQHEYHEVVVCATHVHLDHDNCLETLVLKGDSEIVRELAQKLISSRGVKYGVFNRAPEGKDLA